MTIKAAAELLMDDNDQVHHDRERQIDSLTAELASAAYSVALRHEQPKAWLELELDLWNAVRAATHKWEQINAYRGDPPDALHSGIARDLVESGPLSDTAVARTN